MALPLEANYRHRLYDCYLRSHFGRIHDVSPESLERESRVWRDYLGPLLPEDRTIRILDLGCGYGSFLHFLRHQGYLHSQGVDVSLEQVRAAHALGLENVSHGDCQEYLANYRDEFDCLTAIDLLEHLTKEEVLALLLAAHRALKPSGMLIVRVPNADGPFGARIRYSDMTHELAFTPTSIRQALAVAGFVGTRLFPEGPRVHGLISAARWAAWKMICVFLLSYLAAETGQVRDHVLTQNLIAVAWKPLRMGLGEPQP